MASPNQTKAELYFMTQSDLWLVEKPYQLLVKGITSIPHRNGQHEKHGVTITDLRGLEESVSLEKQGFAITRMSTSLDADDFDDPELVVSVYVREVAEMVKKFMGARRVQAYDYSIRKSDKEFPVSTGREFPETQPSTIVHIDTTEAHTRQIVQNCNGDEAASILKGRYQSVNVWRPLRGPVQKWPLALCDNGTIDPKKDLLAKDIIRSDSIGETYEVYTSEKLKFYYLSEQMPDEVWVMIQSDSFHEHSGVPHAAFQDPNTKMGANERESIEVRLIVSY